MKSEGFNREGGEGACSRPIHSSRRVDPYAIDIADTNGLGPLVDEDEDATELTPRDSLTLFEGERIVLADQMRRAARRGAFNRKCAEWEAEKLLTLFGSKAGTARAALSAKEYKLLADKLVKAHRAEQAKEAAAEQRAKLRSQGKSAQTYAPSSNAALAVTLLKTMSDSERNYVNKELAEKTGG